MPTQITVNQLLIIGAVVGAVFGLIPLILGFTKQKLKLGILGFFLTLIVGTFFSLLGALPVTAVFIWLLLRKPAEKPSAAEVSPENEISGD
ncbi:MAG: hypothetical protein JSS81_23780 [Acidobacteria bacterium]|nr:hypothetical protein [Acidobacteriota bacterium]